jgi:predicted RNA-binding Zn-ribbon protein involved in translation (DUF1610 family)
MRFKKRAAIGPAMTLSLELMRETMRLPCPRCGEQIERTGAAFAAAKQFRCTACGECIKLAYPEKLKLFERARRSHLLLARH